MVNRRFVCDPCRVGVVEARAMDDPPACPDCGKAMEFIFGVPRVQNDISSTEGRVNEDVYIPAFGQHVGSRRKLRDLQERLPEALYERTKGDREVFVVDPVSGKKEKKTIKGNGIRMGEVRTSESKERPDLQALAEKQFEKELEADRKSGKLTYPWRDG